jgi:hypothetical protein
MPRLPTWLIVAGVGAVVALAAADALRPADEVSPKTPLVEASAPDLQGVVVVGPNCSVRAVRLPDLVEFQAPRQTDCGGLVWSSDGTLNASCANGYTDVGTSEGRHVLRIRGCAPAWRPDGALSVIHGGDLIVTRRRGPQQVFVSRGQLADALAGRLQGGRAYGLVEVAWHGSVSFFGIASGPEAWQRALVVYTPEGLTDVIPQLGQRISSLHVSPSGNFVAFARSGVGRELVMLTASGQEVPLPRIGNARAIAWSPDERWVALATRTATFIARAGTRRVVLRIPSGGDTLAWLP